MKATFAHCIVIYMVLVPTGAKLGISLIVLRLPGWSLASKIGKSVYTCRPDEAVGHFGRL